MSGAQLKRALSKDEVIVKSQTSPDEIESLFFSPSPYGYIAAMFKRELQVDVCKADP